MTRRLVLGYLALALVVLVALEVPLGVTYARSERQELTRKVERDAVVLATFAEDALESGRPAAVSALSGVAARYEADTGARVVITDRDGVAVADSSPPEPGVRSFATRPEVARALRGDIASGVRHSDTLGLDLLYVAVPVASNGVVYGAVRVSYPTSAVDRRVHRYWLTLAAIAGVVIAATALIGWALARHIARPLARLEASAAAAGAGDLTVRAPAGDGPPEVRALAETFNDMVARLDDLVRSQEAFVSDASHQLRTPLTALRLRLENLEHDVAPGGAADLDGAQAEVERLSRLVDGLLALARADRRSVSAEAARVDDVVRDRVATWQPLAEEHSVHVGAHLAGPLTALVTPGSLEQVLDNLIENAISASPEGGRVDVAGEVTSRGVEISVGDQGPGMSAEERERAFDRFWRGGADAWEGTGLGLAIVRRLVQADRGDVELEDAPGGGLRAVVRLRPAAGASADPLGAGRPPA